MLQVVFLLFISLICFWYCLINNDAQKGCKYKSSFWNALLMK